MRDAHTVLVAVSVFADTPAEAERKVMGLLPYPVADENSLDCWWIADDNRTDGSDCDSAVFVTPGMQAAASRLLFEEGMTDSWNIVPETPNRFSGE